MTRNLLHVQTSTYLYKGNSQPRWTISYSTDWSTYNTAVESLKSYLRAMELEPSFKTYDKTLY
jgi:hypothetical protein